MHLSIVVPCHNEAPNLRRLHAELGKVLPELGSQYDILFVDDGSTDTTLAVLRELAAADRRVSYLALSRNFGKESAMLAGLTRAAGDAVVLMDGDLQHPPRLLASMVPLLGQGYDQVVARRSRDGDPLVRRSLSTLYYRLMNRFVDVRLTDGAGDFRVLSRRAVDTVLAMPESNRFSKGLFAWIGFDTATVGYRNVERGDGRSSWTLRSLFNYGIDGVISFNHKPLRAIMYFGALVSVLAFLYMGYEVVRTAVSGVDTPGYVTLISAVIGLGGLQLLVLGVIGEYVGRIYHEAKRRPHFVVKETSRDQPPDQLAPDGLAPDGLAPAGNARADLA